MHRICALKWTQMRETQNKYHTWNRNFWVFEINVRGNQGQTSLLFGFREGQACRRTLTTEPARNIVHAHSFTE